tara:strand:- start:2920 stop:3126 length:207 start_codon:yes stop_codon:yes gene_type:complete
MSINSKRAQVKNHISLQRDMKTTAIVNNDKTAYNRYMNRKEAGMKQKRELDTLRDEIDLLKSLLLNNK